MKPVSIVVKSRQGRKACTFITGYEPFSMEADELADELRKACASSTSGTSLLPRAARPWSVTPVTAATSVARAGKAERARGDGAGEADQSRDERARRTRGAGAVDREHGTQGVEEAIERRDVSLVCTIALQSYEDTSIECMCITLQV